MSLTITEVATAPIDGQKPGTSGLRKKTKVFMGEHYLENFCASVFDALIATGTPVVGSTVCVSGDGRFYNPTAIQVIIKMAAAYGVKAVWCGTDGLLSTPAMSAVIRCHGAGFVPIGGFILSASHNPGGIDEDFGIKYNCENGGPAPEKVTNLIYENTTKITSYKLCKDLPDVDLTKAASHELAPGFSVEVFSCVEDHLKLLQKVFDFDAIKALFARKDFSVIYDSMNGVQGPYAKAVFIDCFGAPPASLINAVPLEDFGGHASPSHGHADPNLTHAVELVAAMGLNKEGRVVPTPDGKPAPAFGAAADGDADRNMIMGANFFCSPSDSLAVIVANASCIPYYKGGLKGCARSMPTSCALDIVAKKLGIPCFEVPTGWKFFGNLMDSGTASYPDGACYTPFICGEESFGTGSSHVREKDGLWAVLCWLSILAHHNLETPQGALVGVGDVVRQHWREFGRNFYTRYDYEEVDAAKANEIVARLEELGARYEKEGMSAEKPVAMGNGFELVTLDQFRYEDPVDGSIATKQGVRILFADGSRIIVRLSGTGSVGATVRIYVEKYQPPSDEEALGAETAQALAPLVDLALELTQVVQLTGRDAPTVIT
uniref:phosphoglucomutase (alpha-D-glucose-1,6-bisphosphate-dependent) n=1 Tax=Phaeocystis antarctica TaxID=33657 RepID=A0A7S0EQS2_9EUKA